MKRMYWIGKEYKMYLESYGISSERVYKIAGLPLHMEKEGIYIDRDHYIRLMNAIEESMDDESMIRYSDISQVFAFSPPIFAGLCASNGMECFKRVAEYKKLIGPFVVYVVVNDHELTLEFTFDDENKTKLPRLVALTENMSMINMIRAGTGMEIIPTKIELVDECPKRISDYFGIEPVLSDVNRLHFSLKDVHEPFITKNNVMWHYLEPELKKRIEELETDDTFAAKVRTLLMELIPAGNGTIEVVAKDMALSKRTLQRKLSEENTTFVKQVNHTRELMAKNFLMNSVLSTDEVAYLLGYSDMYVFMRAFRQWTGLTVKQFRVKHGVTG
ncbi:AraC family transcriptional regulator [Acidaminobacter sp. JC074]|uniref:AraC family transcriptional regulator n=1 Tax=Acidaminobacter sp. JC074 TaxID=2530199 RepID=UPI001F0EFF9E|nr:AraC family transcriptional regulator [Acidaminobacter sp. JC074]